MLICYIIRFPVNLILVLTSYILAPFLALWSMKYGPVLPSYWRWFSTLNGTLDGGVEQGVEGFDPNARGLKLWWQRTRWTWRNPCNGWQSEALGVQDITRAFTFKRDLPLISDFYLKLWLGWNPNKRGGNYYPYMFQCGLKKGK
jgi:hypothetical protein